MAGKVKGSLLFLIIVVGILIWLYEKTSVNHLLIVLIACLSMACIIYLAFKKKPRQHKLPKVLPLLKPLVCELGEPPNNYRIKSFTEKNILYDVHLNDQSCSCPDFIEFRGRYRVGDLRRFCKHMVAAVVKSGIIKNLAEPIQLIFYSAYNQEKGIFFEEYKFAAIESSIAVISKAENDDWFSVITQIEPTPTKQSRYKRFGYNLQQDRWSDGDIPLHSNIFRELMKNWD